MSEMNGVKATDAVDQRARVERLPGAARVAMLVAGLDAGIRKCLGDRTGRGELLATLNDTRAILKAFQTEDPWWSQSFEWVSREEPTPEGLTLFATDYETVWTIVGDGKPVPAFAKRVRAWTVARFPLPPREEDVA